ncbi:hypothetical protein [Nesterenkonia alba]|uniref:hypothetical protein n=1 Tax=Nesterenkonia alba TaxID=515814 RepID=UPI0003B603DC|nr:hypothetical protein [Nesterenkonia alba]
MASKQAWIRRYTDTLTRHFGWEVEADNTGDLLVTTPDWKYVVTNYAESDPEYMELNIYLRITPGDRDTLEAIASKITKQIKAVKVIVLDDDRTRFVVGMVLAPQDTLPLPRTIIDILPRARKLLGSAVRDFTTESELAGIAAASQQEDLEDRPAPPTEDGQEDESIRHPENGHAGAARGSMTPEETEAAAQQSPEAVGEPEESDQLPDEDPASEDSSTAEDASSEAPDSDDQRSPDSSAEGHGSEDPSSEDPGR